MLDIPPIFIIGTAPDSAVKIATIHSVNEVDGDFYLQESSNGWLLCDKLSRFSALTIDFSTTYYRYRGGIEYLPKAFRNLPKKNIADATAGWGRDAWLLAYRGFSVTLFERNPYLAFLLEQGLQRAQHTPKLCNIAKRMKVCFQDACALPKNTYAAIYLDPMFPPRRKNAKVKKPMQILQTLLATESANSAQLFQHVLSCTPRIVVKRPKDAPFLGNIAPHHQIIAPNTRYDVYHPPLIG